MAAKPKLTVDEKTAEAIAAAFEKLAAYLQGSYGQGQTVRALVEVAASIRRGKL